ncbi:MAG: hypothetical protein LUH47_08125 [Clostridiales bacterium]|nr:hypothetical protein [Clostridiales bacterium]
MIFSIIGILIGAMITAFGLYYLITERKDPESRKIYTIVSLIGGIIFVAMLIKLLLQIL